MKIKNNDNLEILRSSPEKYGKLIVEICYDNEPIIEINQEKGKENLEAEILIDWNESGFIVKMPLSDLIEALELAKKSLVK